MPRIAGCENAAQKRQIRELLAILGKLRGLRGASRPRFLHVLQTPPTTARVTMARENRMHRQEIESLRYDAG